MFSGYDMAHRFLGTILHRAAPKAPPPLPPLMGARGSCINIGKDLGVLLAPKAPALPPLMGARGSCVNGRQYLGVLPAPKAPALPPLMGARGSCVNGRGDLGTKPVRW